jgi:hypothetical protein
MQRAGAGAAGARGARYLLAQGFTLSPGDTAGAARVLATGPLSIHSCRAAREFGADRLAVVTASVPGGGGALRARRAGVDAVGARLLAAAIASGFTAGGRRYEWLHGKFRSPQALFLAVDGGGGGAAAVRAWHIPPGAAAHEALVPHKYAARMDLAFSRTVPAGRCEPEGVLARTAPWALRAVPDVLSPAGVVMTDGCAGAGAGVMAAAAAAAAESAGVDGSSGGGGGGGGGGPPPSAFQGRLGGHKGVWYLDPTLPRHVITARPSQRKLEQPAGGAETTATQRDVEVVRVARDRGASSLNPQISLLLAGWGVPAAALRALAAQALARARGAGASPAAARAALDAAGDAADVAEARALLDAGLWGEHRLASLLKRISARELAAMGARARVPVPASRSVFVIADPTGTLREGDAYFWRSGAAAPLDGAVLLARNPCHHPDDLVLARGAAFAERARAAGGGAADVARARAWEAALRDVLVLPTAGASPAADALAGGDYDGDIVWVCWEPSLVAPVARAKAAVAARARAGAGAGGARDDAAPAAAAAAPRAPPSPAAAAAPRAPPSPAALAAIYVASLTDGALGYATNLHLAWVDKYLSSAAGAAGDDGAPPRALWEREPMALARLCRVLVDTAKTGTAQPLPDALKAVPYPHYLRGAEAAAGRRAVVHSRSALGLMYDDVAAALAGGGGGNGGGGGDAAGGGGGGSGGGGEASAHLVGLAPPAAAPPARPRMHPTLFLLSEAAGWRALAGLAEAHLSAFIADCMRGRGAPADADASASESGSGGSGDDADALWGGGGGGGGSSSHFLAARARARRRLLRVEPPGGGGGGGAAADDAWPQRGADKCTALALAYYRVAWARFDAPGSSRAEPHAFPWAVAGDVLAAAAAARAARAGSPRF